MPEISTDTSLNCILPGVKYSIDNWSKRFNEGALTEEEKEQILKKATEIQEILLR